MRRQLPPKGLLVSPSSQPFPPRHVLADTVVVNYYSGLEKTIPAIPSLPGFRTSAAFFTSLSANLQIDPDCPSPLATPTTFRANSYSSHPHVPTPLSLSTLSTPHNPYPSPAASSVMSTSNAPSPAKPQADEMPPLNTFTAETEDDRVDGLHLVADSVAQQRQVASKMLVFHPITLAFFALVVAIAVQWTLRVYQDPLVAATTVGGIAMTFLLFIRWMTGPYIGLAEDIDLDWLGDDKLIVVKWGEDIIGALVLGWADSNAAKKRGRRKRGKAVIRAWTVRLKYRRKGVGESLLEEAVRVAGERGADGIIFDAEHANSQRVLPGLFNSFLDKQEAQAAKALVKVADEKGNFRQRQGSPTWGSR